MGEYRVPTYRVPESDLDSPGVVGRRVEITSGGSSYSAGDQLVDTGSSWELINAGVDSIDAGSVSTDDATINLEGADETTEATLNLPVATSNTNTSDKSQRTQTVGTTSKTIIEETNKDSVMALCLVTGRDVDSNRFTDLVLYGNVVNPSVVSSVSAGNATSRSYSLSFPGLELAMESGDATVYTRSLEVSI
jgi:hypothetical protein